MRTAREYKDDAKRLVQKNKRKLAGIFFVYAILIAAIEGIGMLVINIGDEGTFSANLGSSITALLVGPFSLSFAIISVKVFRQEEIKGNDLFSGFKDVVQAFLINFFRSMFIGLWTLLFIVPGIMNTFGYSMAYFVKIDNPDLTPVECLKKSRKMMKGYKMDLFFLHLSYIGHYLLVVLTLGIYGYWLTPKVNESVYLFYLDVKYQGDIEED